MYIRKTIKAYTADQDNGYCDIINGALNGKRLLGKTYSHQSLLEFAKTIIDYICSLVSSMRPAEQDMILYRGERDKHDTYKNFISTSKNRRFPLKRGAITSFKIVQGTPIIEIDKTLSIYGW